LHNPAKKRFSFIFTLTGILFFLVLANSLAAEPSQPLIVNGDTVEYSTENNEVTATGNVEVDYKGAKLTCRKIKVNTLTKDVVAEGNARLDDKKGIIEGQKLLYNFQAKSGTIIDAQFRANPYFGRARKVEKISDNEFIARQGYLSTCSFDKPHYRIGAKKLDMFPGDKMLIRSATFYAGEIPLMGIPEFNQSLTDPIMHMWVMPGHRKDWGYYVLDAWRYNLADDVNGRVYLDYRTKLGLAEGVGLNYNTAKTLKIGEGDFMFYYTKETPTTPLSADAPSEFTRYLMRLRHKWLIDAQTNLTVEAYKIRDDRRKEDDSTRNFLKDYFYREYEKDSQPLSYVSFHHNFSLSSFDLVTQYRLNHWFDQIDKLPEARYTLPSIQIGQTPLYFENLTSIANLNKKASTAPVSADDVTMSRFDTFNKISLPAKVSFIQITPFVASRQTAYDKGANGQNVPVRTIFYSGADLSTKFYRVFNVKSNFLGMDLEGLRHVITPTAGYAYNHTPTVPAANLLQVDGTDAIGPSNLVNLGLSNKLQTKRQGANVDLVDLLVTSTYNIKPKTGVNRESSLSDILFKLKLLPYSWLRLEADATYNRSVSKADPSYNTFSEVNYDFNFDIGKYRSFGIGQRYTRSNGNQLTCNFSWRFNPKWSFSIYERYELGHNSTLSNGSSSNSNEQQYTISRDLHCWTMDMLYDIGGQGGQTVYLVFRLKAFPEGEFSLEQSYNKPKSGSQNNH